MPPFAVQFKALNGAQPAAAALAGFSSASGRGASAIAAGAGSAGGSVSVAMEVGADAGSAAICGAAVGWFLGQSAWPLALGVASMGLATLGLWLATRGLRARAAKH